ncbi:MAG: hypothetical protein ACOCU6_03170 [Nanoarchaeota archaeon]
MIHTTLDELRSATIAHTDAGPYYVLEGANHREAIVKGVVSKVRSSLCYVDIDGECFTTTITRGFKTGDSVLCRLSLGYGKNKHLFTILSMQHDR